MRNLSWREKMRKKKRRYSKKCNLNHRDVQICAGMSSLQSAS